MSEINDYTQYLSEIAIINQIFHLISIIFYVYGVRKWIELENHFMIQQRFPTISKLIVLLSFIACTLTTIRRWVQFQHNDALYFPETKHSIQYILWITMIQSSGQSISFCIYGLINQRLLLIYLRWKRNTICIQSDFTSKKDAKYIYYHPICITIFVFIIIGSLYMLLYRLSAGGINKTTNIINSSFWMIMLIVNIVLIFIIVYKKVIDGIGCLTETVIMLCYLLFNIVLFVLVNTNDSLLIIFPCYVILSSVPFLQGFFPLFIPLYYIYKMEGTLNISQQKQQNKQRIIYHTNGSKNTPTATPVETRIEIDDINKYLGFFQFIEKYDNYKAFCLYLSYSWAIENILFLERVSIIYQIIVKYKKMNGIQHKPMVNQSDCMYNQTVEIHENFVMEPLKFEYLTQIYSEYEAIINENINSNQYDLQYLQKPFKIIYKKIYNEYIDEVAPYQINISSPTRTSLSFILVENINKLETFDAFLNLFNGANEEIGGLLISMYDYKFKQFVQKGTNATNNIFNE